MAEPWMGFRATCQGKSLLPRARVKLLTLGSTPRAGRQAGRQADTAPASDISSLSPSQQPAASQITLGELVSTPHTRGFASHRIH